MEDFIKTLSEDQKKALLQALNDDNSVSNHLVSKQTNDQAKKTISDNFIVQNRQTQNHNRRREPVRGRENKWTDTGEDRDIVTPEFERTPRKRMPPKKVMVECSSCGKEFKADARFLYGEYYRCNRCASKR